MLYSPSSFLTSIITPTLNNLGLFSPNAAQLLLGTALQESQLTYRKQIGGPALGLFQMEPATHNDIWDNFLKYRPALAAKVGTLIVPYRDRLTALEFDDRYAAAMARVKYLRIPAPIPALGNIQAMAAFWKQYYNTPLGKGTAAKFIATWNQYVAPAPPEPPAPREHTSSVLGTANQAIRPRSAARPKSSFDAWDSRTLWRVSARVGF